MSVRVALIVGSLRKGAYSRAIGLELKTLAAPGLELDLVEIGDLPLYNPDLDTETPPPAWTRFRDEVATTEAVLFVTPEYNRSIPGALKNALDVGSRPYGHSVWAKKPAAIVSVSPGALAAFGAQPPPAPAPGLPGDAHDAAARSLYRQCRRPAGRRRQVEEGRHPQVPEGLR